MNTRKIESFYSDPYDFLKRVSSVLSDHTSIYVDKYLLGINNNPNAYIEVSITLIVEPVIYFKIDLT